MMILSVISIIAACLTTAVGQAASPNVVFVITDDQGYGDLGHTGNPVIKTPHIDRLAAESSQLTDYQINLRRWPLEAAAPITAPLPPGVDVPGATKAFRARPGTAIPATNATLRLNGKDLETKPVQPGDKEVTFTTQLTAGSHQLAPTFVDDAGNEIGAYYAIIKRLP